MNKVNFNAKNEYEFGKNLKLLQIVFVNVGIEKVFASFLMQPTYPRPAPPSPKFCC